MLRLAVVLFVCIYGLYGSTLWGQSDLYPFEKYMIHHAWFGEQYDTLQVRENEAFIRFYPVGDDGTHYMASLWSKSHSQSFGLMSNVKEMDDFEDGKKVRIYHFDWHYHNTYDGQSGVAPVLFRVIDQGEGYIFYMTIEIPDRMDIHYIGYVLLDEYLFGKLENEMEIENSSSDSGQ